MFIVNIRQIINRFIHICIQNDVLLSTIIKSMFLAIIVLCIPQILYALLLCVLHRYQCGNWFGLIGLFWWLGTRSRICRHHRDGRNVPYTGHHNNSYSLLLHREERLSKLLLFILYLVEQFDGCMNLLWKEQCTLMLLWQQQYEHRNCERFKWASNQLFTLLEL